MSAALVLGLWFSFLSVIGAIMIMGAYYNAVRYYFDLKYKLKRKSTETKKINNSRNGVILWNSLAILIFCVDFLIQNEIFF